MTCVSRRGSLLLVLAQVCAYANNQWALAGEIQEDLRQTSFYRAMMLAKVLTSTALLLALMPLCRAPCL